MKPIAPNTLLQNRYLIVHLIGKGGMGEVYLAVDQRLGSAIALKRTFFSDDKMLGNAFEREARTLARLRHPVLPKVSDHFTENETQYLAMEHIAGEDLSERLKAIKKPFPLNWVLFWADQLLDALAYLHTHEPPIIHRDIKPQNLKLTDENHIVLLDFGLAKNSVGDLSRVTTSGSVVGYTPHYAPMEQIRGTGTDARSDIYSLSATLYQILTNIVPPDALTRADAIISGLADPIKPISEINPEVTKAVSDVILKGMSISQEPRYRNAREMQKALRDAYARLQSEATEQTVAFKLEDIEESSTAKTVTEFNSVPPIRRQVPATDLQSQISANKFNQKSASEAEKVSTPLPTNHEQNFDATLKYGSDAEQSSQKQSDIKTDVFLAGSSPAIAAAQETKDAPKSFAPEEDIFNFDDKASQTEDFSTCAGFAPPENFSPEATAPLISFDNGNGNSDFGQTQTGTEFDSIPQARASEFDSVSFTKSADFEQENYEEAEKDYSPAPTTQPAPVKSKSKTFAVVGGLSALLFLAIAAAGIGWYTLSGATDAKTDINVAQPTPEAAFSVEPTLEPTLEAVTNTNSSGESEVLNSNANNQTNQETGNQTATTVPTQIPQPTVVKLPPTPTPRTPVVDTPKPPPPTPPRSDDSRPKKKKDTRVLPY